MDNYNQATEIRMLLDVDADGSILVEEVKRGGPNVPIAQPTEFGRVIFGPCRLESMGHQLDEPKVYRVINANTQVS